MFANWKLGEGDDRLHNYNLVVSYMDVVVIDGLKHVAATVPGVAIHHGKVDGIIGRLRFVCASPERRAQVRSALKSYRVFPGRAEMEAAEDAAFAASEPVTVFRNWLVLEDEDARILVYKD